MTSPSELNHRSRKILYAVISEYISTGEPVGSRKLAKRHGLNLSPATIRNVLADLEDAGFLHQPHTSAGRVPSELGFRIFVDALIQVRDVSAADRATIMSRMGELDPRENFLEETGKLLSALTGTAAIVTPPRAADETLSHLRFMPLREGQLLAVLVTRSGAVQNRAIPAPQLDTSRLERINNYLAELIEKNRSLPDIRSALAQDLDAERDLRQDAQNFVDAVAASSNPPPSSLVIAGQGRLFDRPEFSSADKIKVFLKTFEEKENLLQLLDRTMAAGGVHVLIGSETALDDVTDISVISTQYRDGTRSLGSVGIIGPTRMDYAKLMPLVGFAAEYMSEMLEEPDE